MTHRLKSYCVSSLEYDCYELWIDAPNRREAEVRVSGQVLAKRPVRAPRRCAWRAISTPSPIRTSFSSRSSMRWVSYIEITQAALLSNLLISLATPAGLEPATP